MADFRQLLFNQLAAKHAKDATLGTFVERVRGAKTHLVDNAADNWLPQSMLTPLAEARNKVTAAEEALVEATDTADDAAQLLTAAFNETDAAVTAVKKADAAYVAGATAITDKGRRDAHNKHAHCVAIYEERFLQATSTDANKNAKEKTLATRRATLEKFVSEKKEIRMKAWTDSMVVKDTSLGSSPFFLALVSHHHAASADHGPDLDEAQSLAFVKECTEMLYTPGNLSGDDIVANLAAVSSETRRMINGISRSARAIAENFEDGYMYAHTPYAMRGTHGEMVIDTEIMKKLTESKTLEPAKIPDFMAIMNALSVAEQMKAGLSNTLDQTLDQDLQNLPLMSLVTRCGLNPQTWLQACGITMSGMEKRLLGAWVENRRVALTEETLRRVFIPGFMANSSGVSYPSVVNMGALAAQRHTKNGPLHGDEDEHEAEGPSL